MKQLDSIDSLNAIRQKVTTRQTDFNQKELLLLEEVYAEIQEKHVGKKNVILDKGCASCISSAANIVFNYINFHEPRQIEIEKPIPVEDIKIVLEEIGNVTETKQVTIFRDNHNGRPAYLTLLVPTEIDGIPVEEDTTIEGNFVVLAVDYDVEKTKEDVKLTDGILKVPGLKEAIESKKELKDLSLKELRQLYPNIKARSVKEFLHELNQSENGTSDENIQD